MSAACTVADCGKTQLARNLCAAHYRRLRVNGDPEILRHAPQRDLTCEAKECDRPAISKGWCAKHYQRVKKYSSPDDRPLSVRYRTVHGRIGKLRGPATAYPCVDCGGPASDWSYNHMDPRELVDDNVDGKGIRITYSPDPGFYEARCRLCHKRFDLSKPERRM